MSPQKGPNDTLKTVITVDPSEQFDKTFNTQDIEGYDEVIDFNDPEYQKKMMATI